VAGALSHSDAEHAPEVAAERVMCVCSSPTFAFLDDVREATTRAPNAQEMLRRLGAGEL
jgi:hypothetical protein